MSLLTQWGYTLTELDTLPDMLTDEEFDEFTANRYAGDVRIANNIKAACSAIRNHVGWHLYPSAACEATMLMNDRRVTRVGCDLMIQLPAAFVTEVSSVTIDGADCSTFSFETNGILMIYDVSFINLYRYTPIVVAYTAGISTEMMDSIRELAAHQVTHAIAVPSGITSEAAGGVSVTYNAAWVNSTRATDLSASNKEVLSPYRLQGVF